MKPGVALIRERRPGVEHPDHLQIPLTPMSESISARLANVVLPEAGGGEIRLGSLWEKSPAVVVFLRHYG
jgi:hypothetical protein